MGQTFQLAVHLFLQLTVILLACRLMSKVMRYIGQPPVMGEMVAGVLLGPSLLGIVWPEAREFLFPITQTLGGQQSLHPSMVILYALSQIGLVLFMFLVGLELNLRLLNQHSKEALAISLSGVLIPVALGGAFGFWIGSDARLFTTSIQPWQAALFVASAMSITAFPVLARILYDAGHTRSRIGTLAISAAAFNDAIAWVLLACVIAAVKGSPGVAVAAAGGGLIYSLIMVFAGRPLLRGFEREANRGNGLQMESLILVLAILLACAWITDVVGIYSVFGAFVVGVCMPRGGFSHSVRSALEPLTVTLLVPIFFVYTGLTTHMNLLVDPQVFTLALIIIAIAFVSKGFGCLLAARAVGVTWRDSAALGVLMNARGLMEMVLANIALDRGLITQSMFTILILMAIVTTLVAAPLYRRLTPVDPRPTPDPTQESSPAYVTEVE